MHATKWNSGYESERRLNKKFLRQYCVYCRQKRNIAINSIILMARNIIVQFAKMIGVNPDIDLILETPPYRAIDLFMSFSINCGM